MSSLSMILLSIPTVVEILTDRAEWKKNIRDKKGQDVIIRGVFIALMALVNVLFVDKRAGFWQSYFLSTAIFIFFFDYVMGIMLTKNPFFLGTTSQTDRFWQYIPWYIGFLVRGTLLAIAVVLYRHTDVIRALFNLL